VRKVIAPSARNTAQSLPARTSPRSFAPWNVPPPHRTGRGDRAAFRRVVVTLQAEVASKIQAKGRAHQKIWDKLRAGIDSYLDASNEPAYRRIVIQEAPAILGDARFRASEEAYPMALLAASLIAPKRQGELVFDDIDLLVRMICAMIWKLVLLLPQAEEPRKMRSLGQKIIGRLLDSFRPT